MKGYKHAYAPADEEKAVENAAAAYTAAQKDAVKALDIWNLYDGMKKADAKSKVKAKATYDKAVIQAKKKITKAVSAKKK